MFFRIKKCLFYCLIYFLFSLLLLQPTVRTVKMPKFKARSRCYKLVRLADIFSFNRFFYILTDLTSGVLPVPVSLFLRLLPFLLHLASARRAGVPGLRDTRREGNVFSFDMFLARVIAYANHISLRFCTIAGGRNWRDFFPDLRQPGKATSKMYGIIEKYIYSLKRFRLF